MNEDTKRAISRFLVDFAVTAEFAATNPDRANEAWDKFRADYGLNPDQLRDLRMTAIQIRLDPPTPAPTA